VKAASMSTTSTKATRRVSRVEPTWEVPYLFPMQGCWSEEDYLELETNHLVEFSDGTLEVLPMPTTSHQLLVLFLSGLLHEFVSTQDLGTALFAPLRIRLWRGKIREPDILFLLHEHADHMGENFWTGADLVMEVVSGDKRDRERDLDIKRREYARAGIMEYWIVDPKEEQITVLHLAGKRYIVHGEFAPGSVASSILLPGFSVDVRKAFGQGKRPASGKGARKRRS